MLDKLFTEATQAHSVNDLNLAENLYLKILNKYPRESKALFLIGTLYIQKKIYSKAIQYLLDSLSIDSNNDHILMNLGVAYKDINDYSKSEQFFQKAIKLNKNNPDCQNNYGSLLMAKEDFIKAEFHFRQALNIIPQNVIYEINLCQSLMSQYKYVESLTHLKRINLNIDSLDVKIKIIECEFNLKNYQACLNLGNKIIKKLSSLNKFDVLQQLIHSAVELGDIAGAKKLLINLKNNTELFNFTKAKILQETNKFSDSEKIYNDLISQSQYKFDSYHNLGTLYFRQSLFDKAIQNFKHALAINPDSIETKKQLGLCQLSMCNFREGWSNFLCYLENPIYQYSYLKNLSKWNGQGVGDQIFFSSLLNKLSNNNKFYCLVNKKLKNIFYKSFPNFIRFFDLSELSKHSFDSYLISSDLGRLFLNDIDDLMLQDKFLISEKYNLSYSNLIGLSWFSDNKIIGRKKSLSLESLIKALKSKSKTFINLQYGDFKKDIERVSKLHNVTIIDIDEIDKFNDIEGLASLICCCNEVYSISNTTAHLAGALGRNVNVLLPFNHQANTWYWIKDSLNKSLWYRGVNIIEAKRNKPLDTILSK
jgi:tetratricopeptide (TPR) repeat protein